MNKYIAFLLLSIFGSALAAPSAYVVNSGDGTVSVIDTGTNAVIATVQVGPSPLGIATNPSGTKIYVTSLGYGVIVIDTRTNTVTAIIEVPQVSKGIAVSSSGAKIYVTSLGKVIWVIDSYTNTVTDYIAVNEEVGVLVISDDQLYASDYSSNTISVIDLNNNTVKTKITLAADNLGQKNNITDIAVNPEGTRLYASRTNDGTVSVIDTASYTLIDTVLAPPQWTVYMGLAINPSGTLLYIANAGSMNGLKNHGIIAVDTATNTATNILMGTVNYPRDVVFNQTGSKAYVTDTYNFSVIDVATNTVITKVKVGRHPRGIAITPEISPVTCLFNWAAINYPQFFAPINSNVLATTSYTYSYYTSTESYLGVSSQDNHVHYMFLADSVVHDAGPLSEWLTISNCQ